MNQFREDWLKERENQDLALYKKIESNPSPDIQDLWTLSESRFIQWRQRHDFPILLKHFDKTLLLFQEWKTCFNLTNEIIIETGKITPFLEHKKLSGDSKKVYLTKQTYKGQVRLFVFPKKIEGEMKELAGAYHFQLMQEFIPYLDWLQSKGKKQEILYINSRNAAGSNLERVFIHADVYASRSDFELLKMGGIDIPVNGFRILYRGKSMEFVNLCGLKFAGEINFGEEGNLSCSYCACDNWMAIDLNMPLLTLEHCTVSNFNLLNSKLQQWVFYDCQVSGDFYNSKLYSVTIFGGYFNPVIQDCTFSDTHIKTDPNIADGNYDAYKTFKKVYQGQGEDDIAKSYFIKENEFIRRRLKGWNYFTKSLSYYYWEYGRQPHRIIYFSLAIIILFGFIYWLNSSLIAINSSSVKGFAFGDGFYFSTITFTTVGYGDFSPLGWLRVLTAVEAFLGVVNMGFLIAGYSNTKY